MLIDKRNRDYNAQHTFLDEETSAKANVSVEEVHAGEGIVKVELCVPLENFIGLLLELK